jgi:hypothetical protein
MKNTDQEEVTCVEHGYHDPEDWTGIISQQGNQLRERNKAFVDKLGEPHHITNSDDKDSEYQYGYWRLKGGVIRMTRQAADCGWDYYSRCEFPDAEIGVLYYVQKNFPPREE